MPADSQVCPTDAGGIGVRRRRIAPERVNGNGDDQRFTIADAYHSAQLVTYPSSYEGFGNAFLEAIYYHKPILCNRYAIYRTDIEPCGFDVILMDQYLTDEVLDQCASCCRTRIAVVRWPSTTTLWHTISSPTTCRG